MAVSIQHKLSSSSRKESEANEQKRRVHAAEHIIIPTVTKGDNGKMSKHEVTMASLKEWIEVAKNTKKTRSLGFLSAVDFYRFLFPNREPRCKKYYARGCVHGYKKHFYRWAKDVWRPWLRANQPELRTFLKDFAAGGFGVVLFFKPKEA